MAEEKAGKEVDGEKKTKTKTKRSFWSRVWNGLFRLHGDDFEKRLKYITREEATLLARMKRRSSSWRATARNLIVVSVFLEVIAVAYAIITTRSVGLDWQMRAMRVLPIFLLPALSSALYWALFSFTRMRDSRDQKTLDSLRAERQTKIDELKERTNYYTTQQLIQKYDPDPAAKAAAASVLASKLGADSGLKMYIGDELQNSSEAAGKSHEVDPLKLTGLRKRNTSDATSKGGMIQHVEHDEMIQHFEDEGSEVSPRNHVVVEHHKSSVSATEDGGWLARVAALLVGEDPSQSYALICGNCHMHNGLARKEDFPFITYFCPRCHALNKPRGSSLNSPGTSTVGTSTVRSPTSMKSSATGSPVADTATHAIDKVSVASSPVAGAASSPLGQIETSEKIVADDDPASQ